MERLVEETEKLDKRFKTKMTIIEDKLDQELHRKRQETSQIKEWINKHEVLYANSFDDLNRQGKRLGLVEGKFIHYEKIANEFNKHIEALKTHCLTTDLHLESTLPLQVASISYEVCSSLVKKKDYYKFRNNFKKRVDTLE